MATNEACDDEAVLREKLATCEQSLETPLVSGEMLSWLKAIERSLAEVDDAFRLRADRVHALLYREIAAQDPDLLSRVQDMQREEADLKTQLAVARSFFADARARCKEPAEAAASPDGGPMAEVKQTIELIIRIRTLLTALATWHDEALFRDRGVGD
jgi:hypothetical protein